MEVIIMLQNHNKLIRKLAKEMMGRRERYGEEKKKQQLIIQRIPQYLSSMRGEICMLASGIGPLMCNDVSAHRSSSRIFFSVQGNYSLLTFSQMLQYWSESASLWKWIMTQIIQQKQPKSFISCKNMIFFNGWSQTNRTCFALLLQTQVKEIRNKQQLKAATGKAWQSVSRQETHLMSSMSFTLQAVTHWKNMFTPKFKTILIFKMILVYPDHF